jgi:8-oxo-dGTP pyrophosphatase MutT (NUDIX family)
MIGAFIILFNKDNNSIIVEQEIASRGGKYKFIGGEVKEDEDILIGLEREIMEEIGTPISDITYLQKYTSDGHHLNFYYKIFNNKNFVSLYERILKHENTDPFTFGFSTVSIEDFLKNSRYESYTIALNEFKNLEK